MRDTKSSENYECPIFVTLGGQSTREVHPGDRMVREFASASNVFEVTLSTLRLNEKVAVDSRLVQVNANAAVNVKLDADSNQIVVHVNGKVVIHYVTGGF